MSETTDQEDNSNEEKSLERRGRIGLALLALHDEKEELTKRLGWWSFFIEMPFLAAVVVAKFAYHIPTGAAVLGILTVHLFSKLLHRLLMFFKRSEYVAFKKRRAELRRLLSA